MLSFPRVFFHSSAIGHSSTIGNDPGLQMQITRYGNWRKSRYRNNRNYNFTCHIKGLVFYFILKVMKGHINFEIRNIEYIKRYVEYNRLLWDFHVPCRSRRRLTVFFLWIFRNFKEQVFYRTLYERPTVSAKVLAKIKIL